MYQRCLIRDLVDQFKHSASTLRTLHPKQVIAHPMNPAKNANLT